MCNFKTLLYILSAFLLVQTSTAQDSAFAFKLNTPITYYVSTAFYEVATEHFPTKDDSLLYEQNQGLIKAEPTKENYATYYRLACALWELNLLPEAEKMFKKIVKSDKPYYTEQYYHSSDIPGDTTTNIYGYGSYSSNFKNDACRYLAHIYIQKQNFTEALKYTEYADKKYTVHYTCGTGNMQYGATIKGLYAYAYEGLGAYDSVLNVLLPEYKHHGNGVLIRTIKKVFSAREIASQLKMAEDSLLCVIDTFQSSTYYISDNSEREVKYTSGKAYTVLFGRRIELVPPSLEDGQVISKQLFWQEFINSAFYQALISQN